MPRSSVRIRSPRLCFVTALVVPAAGCVFTSERPAAVDVKADIASAYLFRGQVMTDRPVLQPSTAVHLPVRAGGSASFVAWGNLDLTDSTGDAWFDAEHAGEFTEIDLTASYARDIGPATLSGGVVHYTWNNGEMFPFGAFPATAELFVRADFDVEVVRPAIEVHYDIDEVEGFYVRAELAREFALTDDVVLQLQGHAGWSDEDHSLWLYRTSESSFADAALAATIVWHADEVTAMHAGVHGSTILGDDLRDWFDGRVDPDNVWFTTGVTWAF